MSMMIIMIASPIMTMTFRNKVAVSGEPFRFFRLSESLSDETDRCLSAVSIGDSSSSGSRSFYLLGARLAGVFSPRLSSLTDGSTALVVFTLS